MTEECDVKYSPLCQTIERDGKSVEVMIYEDGDGGWILEVVDPNDFTTLWQEPFASDQEALDEALRAVKEDGMDALMEPPENLG